MSNKEIYNSLPLEVQEKVKEVLRVYDSTNITYEYGRYSVTPSSCIKSVYGEDFKFIGTLYTWDVYTEEERIINYIEEFLGYPSEYKGKRDWNLIQKMSELRKQGYKAKIQLINGDAYLYSKEKIEW